MLCGIKKCPLLIREKEMKFEHKSFSSFSRRVFLQIRFSVFFALAFFPPFPPSHSTSITFSCFGYSARNHPFFLDLKKNQQEKRLASHHFAAEEKNSKPSI
jgi:hypothetical protein